MKVAVIHAALCACVSVRQAEASSRRRTFFPYPQIAWTAVCGGKNVALTCLVPADEHVHTTRALQHHLPPALSWGGWGPTFR